MPKKNTRNTRGRIIAAAWKLFYDQGYEETTVEDIVYESQTSKGSFYHYFKGKDELMGTLANVFDEKYEALMQTMDPRLDAVGQLIYLNRELFAMIDGGVPLELLSRLLSTQLLSGGRSTCWTGTGRISRCSGRSSRRGSGRASCGRTAPWGTSLRPTPCGSGRCCTTGACAAGTTPWWPIRTA